jgi:small subunit ribosomal protein S1
VLSRRAVVEAERRDAKERLSKELAEGQILKGTVKSVKDFGAFVDLGGVDGLLHVSQLTHRRMARAQDFVQEGQEVEVRIDSFDRESGKISLSLSHTPPNPWESAEAKYAPGTEVTGRVTRVENFGAFVEVEEGIEALLPTSEMSWSRIRHPSEMLQVGEATRAQVINVDPKARKLTLSLKQIGGDPWAEAAGKYSAGTMHPAKITRVAEFGAFAELEPGIEGLIHISELANTRVRRTEDVVQLGQEVQARVLQVEPQKRRIRLSIKPRDERAEATSAADVQQREQQKKQRQKRLEKKPLKGGLEF